MHGHCVHCHGCPYLWEVVGESTWIEAAESCVGTERDQAANRVGLCSQQNQALKKQANTVVNTQQKQWVQENKQ